MGRNPMLKLQSVTIKYGAITGVQDVDLEVNYGQVVALIGSNGAGKSSTLNGIIGLADIHSGSILFEGVEISKLPPWKRAKMGMKMSPEGRQVIADLTVEENIVLGRAFCHTPGRVNFDNAELWKLFPNLYKRKKVMAGLLSGGEQQMLAIARAIVTNPKLLLLDEPFLGLAPIVMTEVADIITKLKERGTSVLLSEQMARYALPLADAAYILRLGEVAEKLQGEEVKTKGVAVLSHYF